MLWEISLGCLKPTTHYLYLSVAFNNGSKDVDCYEGDMRGSLEVSESSSVTVCGRLNSF